MRESDSEQASQTIWLFMWRASLAKQSLRTWPYSRNLISLCFAWKFGWEYFTDKGIQKGTKKSAKQTFRHEVRNPDPGRTAMVNCDFEKMTRCSVSRV